ncbi:MAG: AglZ/HisF2 family acetamidino modification protein [Fuerstiella sp.]|nr:imidazole glycerol phosphate synthase subunit HisF [Fuerstiella sp.]
MRRIRVIPTLLLNADGGLVKTTKFAKRTYIGDPINAVKIYNEKEVNELLLLDIDATREGREPRYDLIEDIVSEAFMPIGYGGGITSVDQMARLFQLGMEKVVLSTAAQEIPGLVRSASERFGAQSVVVCLDAKRSWVRKCSVYTHCGMKNTGLSPVAAAQVAVEQGAGEIVVYSMERDGTYSGYDLELLRSVSAAVRVPVIACGGARNVDDFYPAIAQAGGSAVAAGSMFVFQGAQRGVLISYPSETELQERLFQKL